MLTDFLIPSMLIPCIKNERNRKYIHLRKRTLVLLRYHKYKTPEQHEAIKKKQSEGKKAYWRNTPKKTLEKMCKKRGKALKAYLNNLTKEEKQNRTAKSRMVLAELYKDPIEKKRLTEKNRRNISVNNTHCIIEKQRVNDYCGTITMSQLEEL